MILHYKVVAFHSIRNYINSEPDLAMTTTVLVPSLDAAFNYMLDQNTCTMFKVYDQHEPGRIYNVMVYGDGSVSVGAAMQEKENAQ